MKFFSGFLIAMAVSVVVATVAQTADTQPTDAPQQLRIEEAKEFVRIYEIRLHNIKVKAEQEDLKWALVNATFEKMEAANLKGAVTERDYRETKEQYDWWKLEDKIQDWQLVEAELNLAKIRLRMVESGEVVYRGNLP